MNQERSQEVLKRDLIRLMLSRVVLVSLFLGVSATLQLSTKGVIAPSISQRAHFLLIGVVYGASLFWAIIFSSVKDKVRFAYFQLIFDSAIVTCMVYITGGVESIFSLLYFPIIICAGFIISKRAGYIIASVSGILYGFMVDLQYYGVIHPIGAVGFPLQSYPEILFLYRTVVHFVAFYLVAFLTGLLTQRLSRSMKDYVKLQSLTNHILQTANLGILVADSFLKILYLNPKGREILDIQGRNYPDNVKELFPNIEFTISDEPDSRIKGHNHIIESFEKTKYLELMVSSFNYSNTDEKGYLILFQDVTDLKIMEQEMKRLESLAMIGSLAARLAHQIKNPLAVISASMEMLEQDANSGPIQKKLFNIVFKEIDRIKDMTQELLFLAKPKKPLFKEIDLKELILEVIEQVKTSKGMRQKINLEFSLPHDFKVTTDPELLMQALINIINNACESKEGAQVILKVSSSVGKDQGQRGLVKISVIDNGPGFSQEALKNLFIPFFTTKEKGAGYGLSAVKAIMDALNGEIHVVNLKPEGAMVSLVFPSLATA